MFLFWLKYKEGGILMTVEEIEIIVTAKIEEALKEEKVHGD